LLFRGVELPPGESETNWLGDQISAFKRSVSVYKGESFD